MEKRNFERSAALYQDAIRLGFSGIESILKLLKISCHLKEKDAIIKYIRIEYKGFKKGFNRTKRLGSQKGKKARGLRKIENKMRALEEGLEKSKI